MDLIEQVAVSRLVGISGVAFGTSGARGLVAAMTDKLCYGYTQGFLRYLLEKGEYRLGKPVAIAGDLRSSSPRIKAACAAAVQDFGGSVQDAGFVPSPALAAWSFARGMPSLMVTGSHIPDDRNGIKFNCPGRELLKSDEPGILSQLIDLPEDRFAQGGALLRPPAPLDVVDVLEDYANRYSSVWGATALQGMRIGVYQHSAVGRDVLSDVLTRLGASVVPLGRSFQFIPVDTEAIRPEDVLLAEQWTRLYELDALVSTDGDSDRPLLADERGVWWRGDVLGVVCAHFLGASTVVTPVSSNSALERSQWFEATRRTKIGSPYVVEAMQSAIAEGHSRVCGFEANGGFLLMDDFVVNGLPLPALPTRDALLPLLVVLTQAVKQRASVSALLNDLPQRFTYSTRLQNLPSSVSQQGLAALVEPADGSKRIQALLGALCGRLIRLDTTDGVRMTFEQGNVVHLRASGNAPELRCYTESGSEEEAKYLAELVLMRVAGWGKPTCKSHGC